MVVMIGLLVCIEGVVVKLGARFGLGLAYESSKPPRVQTVAVRYTLPPIRVNPLVSVLRMHVFTGASVLAASGLWEGGLHSTEKDICHGSVPQSESSTLSGEGR